MTEDHATKSPTGDVEYDQAALRTAEERMHVSPGEGAERDLDPDGGHDAEALQDAASKMGAD